MYQTCFGYSLFSCFPNEVNTCWYHSFTVFTSAALAEIIRGGLNGVDHGQTEVGLAQGMTNFQIFIYIVFHKLFVKCCQLSFHNL